MGDFFQQIPAPFFVLFIFFAGLLVVAAMLLFISSARRRDRTRRARGDDTTVPAPAAAAPDLPDLELLLPSVTEPASRAADTAPSRPSDRYTLRLAGGPVEVADLMTVSRSLEDGSLVVQVGGKVYAPGAGLDDAEARRRLSTLLGELTRQLSEAPEPAASEPEPEPEPPPAEPSAASASGGLDVPRSPNGPVPGDLPKFDLQTGEPLKFRGGRPTEPVPELDIASAIEAYLQYKLEQTPAYAGRSIHVRPSLHGAIRIVVDDRQYEAVADVEDAQTREFLQATIAEWQARQ